MKVAALVHFLIRPIKYQFIWNRIFMAKCQTVLSIIPINVLGQLSDSQAYIADIP